MQAHLARMRARRQRRWVRRGRALRRALLFGGVLGFLHLALVLSTVLIAPHWSFVLLPTSALALLFTLLISTLAGFQATRQSGNDASGIGAGCLTGGIGFLLTLIVLGGALVLLPGMQPHGQSGGGLGSAAMASFAGVVIYAFFTLEGIANVFFGLVGGLIGGLLGKRHASRSNQPTHTAADLAT